MMTYYGSGWFWGMHFFWWIFWVCLIIMFFGLMTPIPRHKIRDTPLQVLQRRYAAGDISTVEYEERKATLARDSVTERR